MKIQFLQHEYRWSDHGITGNKLGWGISASSIPGSVSMLREIEKLSAKTEPDRVGHVPVEEMIYSPQAGFVRMRTVTLPQGEDGRNNKLVRILQPVDPEETAPENTFAGTGEAFGAEAYEENTKNERNDLPLVILDSIREDPDEILRSMNLTEKLPVFLRAIFWCLLDYHGSLNIVASRWEKEEFAQKAGRLMYAVHCMLPASLRKSAGYRSYAWKENKGTAFYFSRKTCGRACFDLDRKYPDDAGTGDDELSAFFYRELASCWKEDRDRYLKLMEEISDYLEKSPGNGMEHRKIQWIFYDLALGQEKNALSKEFIMSELPELMYWGSREDIFKEITDKCLEVIHAAELTGPQEEMYKNVLLEKVSAGNLTEVCKELNTLLADKSREESGEAEQTLLMIREKNEVVYRQLRKDLLYEGEWEAVFLRIDPVEPEKEPAENNRDEGPGAQEISEPEDADRTEQDKVETSAKEERKGTGQTEIQEVCEPEAPKGNGIVRGGLPLPESRKRLWPGGKLKGEAEYRVLDEKENEMENEEEKKSYKEFLLTSLPTGFLTGCAMFLSHYSLMIGHWKIAVGMGGMWMILILNYAYLLKSTQPERPLWMGIGLCLIEGELIEIAATYFIDQSYRLLFFILLGGIAAAIQLLYIIHRKEKKNVS